MPGKVKDLEPRHLLDFNLNNVDLRFERKKKCEHFIR